MDLSTSHERGKSTIQTTCGTTACFVDFWGQVLFFRTPSHSEITQKIFRWVIGYSLADSQEKKQKPEG